MQKFFETNPAGTKHPGSCEKKGDQVKMNNGQTFLEKQYLTVELIDTLVIDIL